MPSDRPFYRVGILTVSDTASRDSSTDKSGPILASLFTVNPYEVVNQKVVPDEVEEIQKTIREWVDAGDQAMDVVICTGGTGLGMRDVTPEAIEPLLDRKTGGLTQALVNHSLSKTPLAALSRLTTGVRHRRLNPSTLSSRTRTGSTLILALPGSWKAVRECCEVLLAENGLLAHALELLSGGDGKVKHREMQGVSISGTETDTGKAHGHHKHSHSHHSHKHDHHHHQGHHIPQARTLQEDAGTDFKTHDPTQSVTTRHRSSPYPIVSMEEALKSIINKTHVNEPIDMPVSSALRGYILAEDARALRSLPPRATTNVDGYALIAARYPPGPYTVVVRESDFVEGCVFRINTGQALPKGADAVIMVEDTDLMESDGKEEKIIQVKAQVEAGENVRQPGSDVKEGHVVLRSGTRIGELGGEIGTLAFLGYTSIRVFRKPKVAVLSTGNELHDATAASSSSSVGHPIDAWGFRVFDSNRPGLSAALLSAGFEVVDLGITTDDVDMTLSKLNKGLEEADVVLSTGGTSMGESDLLKPLMERKLRDGKIHFGRVAMKPGKPTTFATASSSSGLPRILFALPGNPASALVCFYVFVMPCLRKLSGFPSTHHKLSTIKVRLQDELQCDPRPEFHRVVIHNQEGQLCATSTGSQRSSGMHSMATANGLVCVPTLQEGSPRVLARNTLAEAILLGPIV